MRVCLALRRFAPDGGTGRYTTHLARWLVERGHVVHVLCMEAAPPSPGSATLHPEHLVVKPLSVPRLGSTLTMLLFARAVRRAVGEVGADVSLSLARIPGLDVYRAGGGCHDAYLDTVPAWWLSPRHHVERRLDRMTVLGAARVVANAPMPRDELVTRYGLPADRVVVIPNGVDARRFRPDPVARAAIRKELDVGPDREVVVFLGAGFQRKGLDVAIDAVATRPGVVLACVGGDRTRAPWRRRAERRGVDLRLLGARPDPERVLAAGDVLLLPTRYDSAANAVLEAMACGLPVLTSATNGAAAFLPEPWMVIPRADDVDAFARGLGRALEERSVGARCRDVAEGMTWDRSIRAMGDVLESVIPERGERRQA